MKNFTLFVILTIFALAACGAPATPIPEATLPPAPTKTPTPPPTETPMPPTATLTPSPTPQNLIQNTEVSQAAIVKYLAAQRNPDLTDEERIKIAIDAYFTLRYEGRDSVAEQDFSSLLLDGTLAWVKTEKDRLEVERYIACMFDIGYQSYKFNLDYTSIKIKNGNAVVVLIESHEVVFNAIAPEVSGMGGLSHQITLSKQQHGWVIDKDEYRDEFSQLDYAHKENIKKQIDQNYGMSIENPDAVKCQNIIH